MSTRAINQSSLLLMLFLPLLLIVSAIIFEYSGLDVWWVSLFYDAHKHLWPYKHHWLFEDILHTGGQLLDKIFMLICLISFIVIHLKKELASYRKIFLYFLLASAAGPILVGIGKSFTHIYSPWGIQLFNGLHPYVRLFDHVPAGAPVGHAFPAGHASGGYCFLSLYFVLLKYRSPYRLYALISPLILGFAFGLAQQIRGAHFPSHDMATIIICWYAAMLLYFLFYPEEWKKLSTFEYRNREKVTTCLPVLRHTSLRG